MRQITRLLIVSLVALSAVTACANQTPETQQVTSDPTGCSAQVQLVRDKKVAYSSGDISLVLEAAFTDPKSLDYLQVVRCDGTRVLLKVGVDAEELNAS